MLHAHLLRASNIRPYDPPRLIDEATDELLTALYDFLGPDHFVTFTEDRWTVEHSLACRLTGAMEQCVYHQAVANVMDGPPPDDALGRWRITDIDEEGCPAMVRAETP